MSRAAEAFAACDVLSKDDIARLHSFGLTLGMYELFQTVAPAKVLLNGRTFDFSENGSSVYVTPIRCADPVEIEHLRPLEVVTTGAIFDLIAWHPARPGRFALYRDTATVLGTVEPQLMLPPPVTIHRSVLNWLRAGCTGLMLLGRNDAENKEILQRLDSPVAEDADHARELERIETALIRNRKILFHRSRGVAA